jgi:hypothetical protein
MPELMSSYLSTVGGHLSAAQAAAIEALTVGIIATVVTDLWQRLLQDVAGLPPANWALVRRWVAWIPRGVLVHRPITATPQVRGELVIGWVFHYAVGVADAALYLAIMRLGFGLGPTLLSALVFAIALLVAPWLVMQPALGLGFMASRTPNPAAVRAIMSVHAVFGLGLYLGAVAWAVGAA